VSDVRVEADDDDKRRNSPQHPMRKEETMNFTSDTIPELKQIVGVVRADWVEILKAFEGSLDEVMTAGERQRLAAGKDPHAWTREKPLDRLNHVLHHILHVHHAQNPNLLTGDTYLRQIEHAMVGLAIILVNLNKEPERLTESVEE